MDALEKLKEMVNKVFILNNEEVVIVDYATGVGDEYDECEIYLNNGKILVYNIGDLIIKLERFRPVTKNVMVLVNERINSVSTVNPSVIGNLKDTVMDQIELLKTDPSKVNQAKQIFNGVNTIINLAKTELEYRRYINQITK